MAVKESLKPPLINWATVRSRALAGLALSPLIALSGCALSSGSDNHLKLAKGQADTASLTPAERTLSNQAQQNMDQLGRKIMHVSQAITAQQFRPTGSLTAVTTGHGEAERTTWIPDASIFGTKKPTAYELILEAPLTSSHTADFSQPDVVALSDGEVSDSSGRIVMSTSYTSALFARVGSGWVFEGDYNSPKSTQSDPTPLVASTIPVSGSMTFNHKSLGEALGSIDGLFGDATTGQLIGDFAMPFQPTPGDNPVPIEGVF